MKFWGNHLPRGLLLTLLFSFAPSAFAQNSVAPTSQTAVNVRAWPESFFQSASARPAGPSGFTFTNALFDGGDDSVFFEDDFDPTDTFPIQISRDTYNNFDLLHTSTVVDHVKLYLETPLVGFGAEYQKASWASWIPFPFVNLNLNVRGYADFRDIRQVGNEEVQRLSLAHEQEDPSDTADDLREINPYLQTSPLKFYDPAKLPFKVPFSRRDLRKMRVGEIVSYTLSGQVGFGVSVGAKLLPTEFISIGSSLLLETYLIGDFEVLIQKEDERHAKVRISRLRGRSNDLKLQAGILFRDILRGFFVFKNGFLEGLVNDADEGVSPFQLKIVSEKDRELSVAYRYDLDTDEGRDCFHHAVLGHFTPSDELAAQEVNSSSPRVSRLFTRTSLLENTEHSAAFDISPIFSRGHASLNTIVSSQIDSAEGEEHVLRDTRELEKKRESITGNNEKFFRKVTVLVDEESFKQGKPGGALLTFETTLEDKKTDGKALNRYTAQVQGEMNYRSLFPQFPVVSPDPSHEGRFKKVKYKKSAFYYGYSFKEAAIAAFLRTDPAELSRSAKAQKVKWDESAFLSAKTAFAAKDPVTLVKSLNVLFSDEKHFQPLLNLLLGRLDESLYEKFLVAQNQAFGNIQLRGHRADPSEQLTETDVSELEHRLDPNAFVDQVTSDFTTDGKLRIHFRLSAEPEFLYFDLTPYQKDGHPGKHQEWLIYNRDHHFTQGEQELILDPDSTETLSHDLGSQLKPGNRFDLTFGFKRAGQPWGYGANLVFSVNSQ